MVPAVGIDFGARSCSVSRVDRTHRVDLPVRMLEVANMGQDCSPEEVLVRAGNRQWLEGHIVRPAHWDRNIVVEAARHIPVAEVPGYHSLNHIAAASNPADHIERVADSRRRIGEPEIRSFAGRSLDLGLDRKDKTS